MGVPYHEIDLVPEEKFNLALTFVDTENRAEKHLHDVAAMKAKRSARSR